MITCIVCGELVKSGSGAVYSVLDGFVGVHSQGCHGILSSRLGRLLQGIANEFEVERKLMAQPEEPVPCASAG